MASTSNALSGIDGSKKKFPFDFPYQKKTDIKVELISSTAGAIVLDSTKFSPFESATEILFNGDGLTVDSNWQAADGAPLVGITGRVYRDTDSSLLAATFYPGSAIRSSDLNNNYEQNLYVSQESENDATDALSNSRALESGEYVTAIDKSIAAVATAGGAVNTANATETLVHTYVHDGTNLQGGGAADGQPEGVKYAVDVALAADNIADEARDTYAIPAKNATDALVGVYDAGTGTWTTKGHADAGAGDPESGVGKALDDAANAVSVATTADNIADEARDTYAIPAKTAADAAKSATDTYVHDGTTLTGGGPADSQPKGVKYAIDQVETYVHDGTSVKGDGISPNPKGVAYAITVAEEASASVAASAIYKVVADLSTLTTDYPLTGNQPSPPGPDPSNLAPTPDGTFVQITDSTGISYDGTNWTTGFDGGAYSFPNGFSGHSQLTLRVKVSNASAGSESYIVQEYYANDPEARYGEVRKILVENERTISESETIQTTMNAHSVGPVTLSYNGTALTYNATTYVTSNSATAGYTITIPENSTWLIS